MFREIGNFAITKTFEKEIVGMLIQVLENNGYVVMKKYDDVYAIGIDDFSFQSAKMDEQQHNIGGPDLFC